MGDGSYYLIERFDRRPDGSRVHFEDFAQILDRPLSGASVYRGRYEELAAVIQVLCPSELSTFVSRLVFCVVAGNGDAHLKNWALQYPDGRSARLTPAYDLVSTVVYPRSVMDDELALPLNGSKRFEDLTLSAFEPMARVCKRTAAEVEGWVVAAAQRTREAWHDHGAEFGYSTRERERIEAHLSRVTLK